MKKNNCTNLSNINRPPKPRSSGKKKISKESKEKVKTMFYHTQ